MSQAISRQHPAVVLRSHYAQLRNLLAVAMIGIVGLSGAVVILANEQDDASSTTSAKPVQSVNRPDGIRYDGGPEEGTSAIVASRGPSVRYDGGPEEGTSGIFVAPPASVPADPAIRYDGGPEEGTSGITSSSAPSDGGSQETLTHPGPSTD
jgi:hypothetical protein